MSTPKLSKRTRRLMQRQIEAKRGKSTTKRLVTHHRCSAEIRSRRESYDILNGFL